MFAQDLLHRPVASFFQKGIPETLNKGDCAPSAIPMILILATKPLPELLGGAAVNSHCYQMGVDCSST